MKSHMLQLDPTIPVIAIKDGKKQTGQAIGWFDYSKEDDLLWLVAFDKGGECWLLANKYIRLQENYSLGRNKK